MKNYSILALAAAAFLAAPSCNTEMTSTDITPKSFAMTFKASTEATKTVLGEDGRTINWAADDSISVFRYYSDGTTAGANNLFKITASGIKGDGSADFGGEIVDLSGSCTEAGSYFAATPYIANAYLATGDKILVSIPEQSVGVAGGFPTVDGASANPMIAKGNAGVFAFKNVAAIVKFKLNYNDVNCIEFEGNNDEVVAGTFFASIDESGNAAISDPVEGKMRLSITSADLSSALDTGYYYLVVNPQTFTKGVTFTMSTIFGQTRVKTTSSSIEFKKASVASVGDMVENITLLPVEWPLCNGGNTKGYHPEWTESKRFYSGQPARASMEFVENNPNRSAAYVMVPSYTNSDATLVSSPSFVTNGTVKKVYLFTDDSFYFSVKLDNFSGRLKFTLPVVNTGGPKFWYLSFSTNGTDYTTIDAQDFVVTAIDNKEYTTNATWDCHFWNNNNCADEDKKCNNILSKEIPYDFNAFTGTLRIRLSVAPITAPETAKGQIIRNASYEKCVIVTKLSSSMCSRFFFADASTSASTFAATPISISVVEE